MGGEFILPSLGRNPSLAYALQVAAMLRFVQIDSRHVSLTERGRQVIHAADDTEESQTVRSALMELPKVRVIVEVLKERLQGKDQQYFKLEYVANVLREVEPTLRVSDETMRVYALRFVSWLKAARIVARAGGKAYAFRTNGNSHTIPTVVEPQVIQVESPVEPIYRLSTIIAGLLSDPEHKVSEGEVMGILDEVAESGKIDHVLLEMLKRELKLAVETHDRKIIALAGRNLKDIRRRYIEIEREEVTQ